MSNNSVCMGSENQAELADGAVINPARYAPSR
jgi:hypothetical protein